MDITQFSEQLFNSEAMPPHSVQVEFDGFDVEKLFKALCLIFSNGLRKNYGDDNGKVDIDTLSLNDITHMNDYFKSMGLQVFLCDVNTPYQTTSELSGWKLDIKGHNVHYMLFFDYLKIR